MLVSPYFTQSDCIPVRLCFCEELDGLCEVVSVLQLTCQVVAGCLVARVRRNLGGQLVLLAVAMHPHQREGVPSLLVEAQSRLHVTSAFQVLGPPLHHAPEGNQRSAPARSKVKITLTRPCCSSCNFQAG